MMTRSIPLSAGTLIRVLVIARRRSAPRCRRASIEPTTAPIHAPQSCCATTRALHLERNAGLLESVRDQIALDVEQSGAADRAPKQLMDSMGNCVACIPRGDWLATGATKACQWL